MPMTRLDGTQHVWTEGVRVEERREVKEEEKMTLLYVTYEYLEEV